MSALGGNNVKQPPADGFPSHMSQSQVSGGGSCYHLFMSKGAHEKCLESSVQRSRLCGNMICRL